MLERLAPILRVACVALAALVLYQMSRLILPRGQAMAAFRPGKLDLQASSPAFESNAVPGEITARIEKIKESQILGQIMRPPPMALLGIAGKDALLRGPNGQTGLLREGEDLGGVKLLRIGTNRVLVEHEGQTKELTLFQGFGSEPLLPKGKDGKTK